MRLNRPLREDESHRLLLPARISAARLGNGAAEIDDLHNICAFLNVGSVLARDIGEGEAFAAIQAGVIDIGAIKDRGGPTYAMNAAQRSSIQEAVRLVDDLFGCTTVLEIDTAHRKLIAKLPMTGELKVERIEI